MGCQCTAAIVSRAAQANQVEIVCLNNTLEKPDAYYYNKTLNEETYFSYKTP
jgi:hypothetical protein